jgi:GT2 family glycosyltransferase
MFYIIILFAIALVASQPNSQDLDLARPNRGRKGGEGVRRRVAPVPMIAVTLNEDRRKYLLRLLKSIDYPVDLVLVTIGNSNATAVQEMKEEAERGRAFIKKRFRGAHVVIKTLDKNPGAAAGFNTGLRYLQSSVGIGKGFTTNASIAESAPVHMVDRKGKKHMHKYKPPQWGIVVNTDIAFYPDVLFTLAHQVEEALTANDKCGIGFTGLCCGSEWSAVVFTTRVAQQVGLMDENFYPAYYEDEDYGIRVHLSGLQAVKFGNTALQHGELDGTKDYLSGLFNELYLNPRQDEDSRKWRRMHQRGVKYGHDYLERKWGVEVGHFDSHGTFHAPPKHVSKLDCKSVSGINGECRPRFSVPFDDKSKGLQDWTLDEKERASIMAA